MAMAIRHRREKLGFRRLPVPVHRAIQICSAAACSIAIVVAAGCSSAIDQSAIADAQTAMRVRTALINHPDLGARTIEVRVVRGVVELSGRVLTRTEADQAIALARTVPGVADVRSLLQIGSEAVIPPNGQSPRAVPGVDPVEPEDNPGLLALGGSVGWSTPRGAALKTRVALSPLIKLGSGRGFGVAVGLNWFQAELQSLAGRPEVLTRIHVKPIMLGAAYTFKSERLSVSASVVGGYAWNSLTVTDTGTTAGLPVEVDNSLVWRPGASVWYDLSRRTALNVSVGHVLTRLRITFLEGGRLEKRDTRGDTTIVHVGIAYRLF
jgi:hyperosmotically inducible protein